MTTAVLKLAELATDPELVACADDVAAHMVAAASTGSRVDATGACERLVKAVIERVPHADAESVLRLVEGMVFHAFVGDSQRPVPQWLSSREEGATTIEIHELGAAVADECEYLAGDYEHGWRMDTVASQYMPHFMGVVSARDVLLHGDTYWELSHGDDSEVDGPHGPCRLEGDTQFTATTEAFASSSGGWTGEYRASYVNTYYYSVEQSEEVFKHATLLQTAWGEWNDELWDEDVPSPGELAERLAPELAARADTTLEDAAAQLREALPGLSVKEPGPLCDVVWEAAKYLTEWPGGSALLGERPNPRT